MSTPMQLAVNALNDRYLTAQRLAYGRQLGGNDAKRPQAWCEYGFANDLVFDDYYRMYERHGVAHGAIHLLLDKCWETNPQVIQGDEVDEERPLTPWEKKFNAEARRLKLWQMVKQADRRRMVGNYAGLILQVKDNKTWEQELTGGVLQRLIPAWQGQLRVTMWDSDPKSERYGMPTMWSFDQPEVEENTESTNSGLSVSIHWTRVILLGDYRDGVPFLKAGYNDCVTMEKIIGGSGESYLKNAARQLAISFDKDTQIEEVARSFGVPVSELHTAFDEIAKGMNRGQDTALGLQGAQVTTLVSTVPDPQPPFNVALMSFAASVQMPAKIISGSQTGERASSGDIEAFNKRGQGRREGELSDDIDTIVRHLIQFKLLPPVPGDVFTVCWSDLTESTQSEKLANALVMAQINEKAAATGDRVFSVERMVTTAGFELEPDLEPLPDLEPVDPTVDEAADGAPADSAQ